jgi:SAM-dependent methyltransferase
MPIKFSGTEPASAWADGALWDCEYQDLRSIPSSHRIRPSRAFQKLESRLRLSEGAAVLDAGAGTGRHSVYLASKGLNVHAVDASYAACSSLAERINSNEMATSSIHIEQAVLNPKDVPDATYDLIIDSYASCHLLSNSERLRYLESLIECLRPGGWLYTACIGTADGYYGQHLLDQSDTAIARDPLNGICKLLQTREAFGEVLRPLAKVEAITVESFSETVGAETYGREVLAALLRRPD